MPLDVVRFHWSQLSIWLQVPGALTLIGSFTLMYLAFRENAYLTPTVRIQEERGQTVVSTGLYQYVRHPMYTGFLLFFIGTALLLGSLIGFLFSLVLIGLIARRAVLEEQTLQQGLVGYNAYMAKVNYRFIPHVW
jgi:protein-S-isoprenylcysteine O-methyltransferase Ste14